MTTRIPIRDFTTHPGQYVKRNSNGAILCKRASDRRLGIPPRDPVLCVSTKRPKVTHKRVNTMIELEYLKWWDGKYRAWGTLWVNLSNLLERELKLTSTWGGYLYVWWESEA